METVFERKGNILKAGKNTAKIPSIYSALGILAANNVHHGEEFADDYWVYRTDEKGKRVSGKIRKWFLNRNFGGSDSFRIWLPNLQTINLQKLESVYFRLLNRMNRLYNQRSELVDSIVRTKKLVAYAKPTHKYEGKQGLWWKYDFTVHKNDYVARTSGKDETVSWGWGWLDEKPKNLINHKLGQKLYEFEFGYQNDVLKRLCLFQYTLEEVINSFFKEKIAAKEIKKVGPVCLTINDRKYWYVIEVSGWGTLVAKKITWADDDVIVFKA